MPPENGYVKLWRQLLDCEDLRRVSPAMRYIFLTCVLKAHYAKGQYYGVLVGPGWEPRSISWIARRAAVNKRTALAAVDYFTSDEVGMLAWKDVRLGRALRVINYGRWQAASGAEMHRDAGAKTHRGQQAGGAKTHRPAVQKCTEGGAEMHRQRRKKEEKTPGLATAQEGGAPNAAPIDFESDGLRGVPAPLIHNVRMHIAGPLNDLFADDRSWNGGVEQMWAYDTARMIQNDDATADEVERWLVAEDTRPTAADITNPRKWFQRMFAKRGAEDRRKGRGRVAKPKPQEGGTIQL